jgi:DNA-binding MarR family transcriptional regulator
LGRATTASEGSKGVAKIIEIMNELSTRLGVPVLTAQYEIALTLLECTELTADQLMQRSSLSRAGCFNTIDRLKIWGVVVSTASPVDRRHKLYRLEDSARDLIISRFDQYRLSHISFGSLGIHQSDLESTRNTVRRGDKLDHLSCEYQVLLYLYLISGASNTELRKLVDSSGTKVNGVLGDLVGRGLVHFTRDKKDQRRKLYYINNVIRDIMDKAHRDVFEWLDAKHAAACRRSAPIPTARHPDFATPG